MAPQPIRFIYSLIFTLGMPLVLLRFLWRSRNNPEYRHRWLERCGIFACADSRPAIWLHAVSLGEFIAAVPLIKAMLAQHPQYKIVVTTTTPTGSKQVQKVFPDQVFHVYTPLDTPWAVRSFLKRINAQLAVIMETELWPNILHYCRKKNVPVLLANARLSPHSFAGYQRLGKFTANMLQQIKLICAQSELDQTRFIELGADPKKVIVAGNIKFDLPDNATELLKAQELKQAFGANRPTWVAASTHAGEEEIILRAQQALLQDMPELLLILVPRHPERFAKVAELAASYGLKVVRRSDKTLTNIAQSQVYLGDTMGELRLLYAAAQVAFVGGSFVSVGGHNLLEPAQAGVPVLSGPNLFNFVEIKDKMLANSALTIVNNEAELIAAVKNLIQDTQHCHHMGQAGAAVVKSNKGAVTRLMQQVEMAL